MFKTSLESQSSKKHGKKENNCVFMDWSINFMMVFCTIWRSELTLCKICQKNTKSIDYPGKRKNFICLIFRKYYTSMYFLYFSCN